MARGIFTLKQQLQGLQQKSWNDPISTYAGSFNGSNQYLTVADDANLQPGSGAWTIEFFAKPAVLSTLEVYCKGTNFQIYYLLAGTWAAYLRDSSNNIVVNASFGNVTVNSWQHIAVVFTGSAYYGYLNGAQTLLATSSSLIGTGSSPVIIGAFTGGTTLFSGALSNVRFVKGTAIYTSSFAPPTRNLTAISGTQLLTLQNATIVDNSANTFTITNSGSVATSTSFPFNPGLSTPAVDYLVVAGGGGGGYAGGGGGAGGLLQGTVSVVTGSSITVTVGGGGAAATQSDGSTGGSGQNSVLGSITALGGGGGGAYNGSSTTGQAGVSGGSGGGGATISGAYRLNQGGQGTSGQGNSGGIGHLSNGQPYAGAGGGGAGTVGFTGGSSSQYDNIDNSGGSGIASAISGTVTTYAGGGSGSRAGGAYVVYGVGGVGGGGNQNASGGVNTGGGGGGGNAAGGSGIVIVSYPDVYAGAASTTGSPTVSTSGSGSWYYPNSIAKVTYSSSYNSAWSFGTGDFTVEGYCYLTSGSSSTIPMFDARSGATGSPWVLNVGTSTNQTYFYNGTLFYSSINIAYNTWNHIAVTRQSGTLKIWINGAQGYTGTVTANLDATGPLNIGDVIQTGQNWLGYLSNMRIVKGTSLYNSAFTPSTIPLTAVSGTTFLNGAVSGSPYLDSSTTNALSNSGTTLPTWNQLSPFATGLGYKNRVYTWTSSGSITF